jgi:hypothetical protein
MPKISIAQAGFLKGVFIVAVLAVVSYLSDATHLTGIVTPAIATIAAGLFSSLESYLKAQSGNTTALFGAVTLE